MPRSAYLVLLSLVVSTTVSSQSRPASAMVEGAVTDTSLVALSDAEASIRGTRIRVVTGPSGRFRILGLRDGRYVVDVRRLGYAPVSATVDANGTDTVRLTFALRPVAIELDTVIVAVSSRSARLQEFEVRRKQGEGQFMTQAEIELHDFPFTSDLLRTFRGRAGAAFGAGCKRQYFVDDVAVFVEAIDRDLPTPREITGVEVYTGPASIPLKYKTTAGGGFCGVVLIWTKDGT